MTKEEKINALKTLGTRDEDVDALLTYTENVFKPGKVLDDEIYLQNENGLCAVSTEFYVLRGKGNQNIGFIVPLLLSDKIQIAFANAVEGSQHPRFKEDVMLEITIPKPLMLLAEEISKSVVENVSSIRKYEKSMINNVRSINKYIS